MEIHFHSHAEARMLERGTTKEEVRDTIKAGEYFTAKYGRSGFKRVFSCETERNGICYNNKQVEAYAVKQIEDWLVITVIVKYF